MSSLDQAFIRAYAKDRAAQPSAPPEDDRPEVHREASPLWEPHTLVAWAEGASPPNSQTIVSPPGSPPLLAMPSLTDDIASQLAARSFDDGASLPPSSPAQPPAPARPTANAPTPHTPNEVPREAEPNSRPPTVAEHRADPPQTAAPVILIDGPASHRVPRPHRRGFGSAPPHPSHGPDRPTSPSSGNQHVPSRATSASGNSRDTIRRIDPAAPSAGTATIARRASAPAADPAELSQPDVDETTSVATQRSPSPIGGAESLGYRVERLAIPRLCERLLHAAAPMFDRLATDMMGGIRQGRRVCLVTSPKRGEGRTMLALCLASLLAGRGVRVLLADGDFDSPALAANVGIEPEIGWEAVTSVGIDAAEILIHSVAQPGLSLLPLGGPWPHTADSSEPLDWKRDLATLRDAFDLVLIDGSPLSGRPLTECIDGELAGSIDTALLVRSVGQTTADELLLAQRRLERLGIMQGGVAENFVSTN